MSWSFFSQKEYRFNPNITKPGIYCYKSSADTYQDVWIPNTDSSLPNNQITYTIYDLNNTRNGPNTS